MTHKDQRHFEIENREAVLIVRVDGGPHALFGPEIANELEEWWTASTTTQASTPSSSLGRIPRGSSAMLTSDGCRKVVPRLHRSANAAPPPSYARPKSRTAPACWTPVVAKTPLQGAVQLDRLHATFLRMNGSGVIFVAALNGSTLGLGAEVAWACDLRVMADGDFFIGHPEVLLGINPGGGGTQRLTRLIGTHRSLVAILDGKPFTPAEALANGAVDELVPQEKVVARAVELAEYFGSRPKGAIAEIKRSVYFGGSMSLSEGLHVERTEFLIADQSKEAQNLMLGYLATTDATGALPLYNPDTYARALESGRVPGRRATDGA